jgi:hypothetical protein
MKSELIKWTNYVLNYLYNSTDDVIPKFEENYKPMQDILFKKYSKRSENLESKVIDISHTISPTIDQYLLRIVKEATERHHRKNLQKKTKCIKGKLISFFVPILEFLERINEYHDELNLILSKLILHFCNGFNEAFVLLVGKILTVKKLKYLHNLPIVRQIPKIQRQLKEVMKEGHFLNTYNFINNSFDEEEFTEEDTKYELDLISDNLLEKLYYYSIDSFLLDNLNEQDYKIYVDELGGTVDGNENIYLTKDVLSSYRVFFKAVLHEMAHLKTFRSSKNFYPISGEKIREAGCFLQFNTTDLDIPRFNYTLDKLEKNLYRKEFNVNKEIALYFKYIEHKIKHEQGISMLILDEFNSQESKMLRAGRKHLKEELMKVRRNIKSCNPKKVTQFSTTTNENSKAQKNKTTADNTSFHYLSSFSFKSTILKMPEPIINLNLSTRPDQSENDSYITKILKGYMMNYKNGCEYGHLIPMTLAHGMKD